MAMATMKVDPELENLLKEKILHLVDTQPRIEPDLLEVISMPRPTPTDEEQAAHAQVMLAKGRVFKQAIPDAPPPEEGAEELIPLEVEGNLGDLLKDMALLERAGVGFGKEENFRLFLALKELLHKHPGLAEGEKLLGAKLWGKVVGVQSDYIIAECVVEGRVANPPLPEEPPRSDVPPDPVGSGAGDFVTSSNEFVYYVTPAPGQAWTRLPDAQPGCIRAARVVRKYFTGELTTRMSTTKCPFPGTEGDYLRAQIARIVSDCRVAPHGHLADRTAYAEGGALDVSLSDEGSFLGMTGQALCELSKCAWVHSALSLLPQGRSQYYNYGWTPPDDNPEAKDPRKETNLHALRSVHLDPVGALGGAPWAAHVCGGKAPQYSSAVVRSSLWPGACAAGWGYHFVNFYVGTGLQETGTMFAPLVTFAMCPDVSVEEYKLPATTSGVAGDLNLEPPPKPEEGEAAAE